jgi:hypothetical protein
MAAFAAVELGRRGRRDERMRARIHLDIDAQLISAHDAAGRMHEVHVARIAFGIEGALNDERSFVVPLDEPGAVVARCDPFC